MKKSFAGLAVLLVSVIFLSGCWKKNSEQANMASLEFDSLNSSEELAQLPQSNASNQQAAVEVLPVETSPVTQNAVQAVAPVADASIAALSHEQKIQAALKNAGFYQGNVDGKIGPMTRKAIEAFQKANGLKADGKVGPMTWKALETYLSGQSAPTASTGSAQ